MNIGLIFGGRSVEHDVSIVSAQTILKGFEKLPQYAVTPIYLAPDGRWIFFDKNPKIAEIKKARESKETCKLLLECSREKMVLEKTGLMKNFIKKRVTIDLVVPIVHGTNGEDGTLQGLLEMINVPYVGCGVGASALGMDKVHMKEVFENAGLPIVGHLWFSRSELEQNRTEILNKIEAKIPYPVFVKPANLGSSIGIAKATDRESLETAIEVASRYDGKIIVERAVVPAKEINCAVLGNDSVRPSVLEQPMTYEAFLTFQEKYVQKGGSMKGVKSRVKIPAPISEEKTKEIKELAVRAFKAIGGSGTARVDFLLDEKETVYVNEINTLPGSFQQHLWKSSGIELPELLHKLIDLARETHAEKQKNLTFYRSELV